MFRMSDTSELKFSKKDLDSDKWEIFILYPKIFSSNIGTNQHEGIILAETSKKRYISNPIAQTSTDKFTDLEEENTTQPIVNKYIICDADIALVIQQSDCTHEEAKSALYQFDGDVVNAIMLLFNEH